MLKKHNTDSAWDEIIAKIGSVWPADRWSDLGVVVGCSGGADSVALLRAVCDLRSRAHHPRGFVIAAHYNHRTRGEASDADQKSVEDLAKKLTVRFVCERAEPDAASDEASMRQRRRDFFCRVAGESGSRYIATAHHADDNVETVLHHLMRGTGPAGMAGMPVHASFGQQENLKDFVLVRPMLAIRRTQIHQALQSIGQPWREDESNAKLDYRRNWLRHRLIPLMESEYPDCVSAIGRTIELQDEWRTIMHRLALDWLDHHHVHDDPVTIARDGTAESAIIVTALQHLWDVKDWPRGDMAMHHWTRITHSLRTSTDERYDLPGNIDVTVKATVVTFTRVAHPSENGES